MLGNEMYNPGMVLHLFKILPKNKLFCVCRYTYYCSGYLGLGVKKETCCEVVLSDAECEWQGFVCPLQCSLAQVAAPGTAQLLHHCMGEQRWAQPSPAGKPQGSCSWEPAPRGETQITPTQGSKERNMQLLGEITLLWDYLALFRNQMFPKGNWPQSHFIIWCWIYSSTNVCTQPWLVKLNHISLFR